MGKSDVTLPVDILCNTCDTGYYLTEAKKAYVFLIQEFIFFQTDKLLSSLCLLDVTFMPETHLTTTLIILSQGKHCGTQKLQSNKR